MNILRDIKNGYNVSKIVVGRKINYSKMLRPLHLVYFVTKRCNSKCIMCNIWKKKVNEKELTIDELKEIGKSKYLRNVLFFGLSGGEPFLRKDLVESVIALTSSMKKLKQINFSTNGLLTKKIVKDVKRLLKLKKTKIDVALSVEGIGEKNNKIRGVKGGYKKVLETIKVLKDIDSDRIDISIRLAILPSNYKEIPKLYKLANEIGINFTCKPATSGGLYENQEDLINWSNEFSEKQKEEAISEINKIVKIEFDKLRNSNKKGFDKIKETAYILFLKYSTEFIKNPNKVVFPCYALFSSVSLESEGSVYSCPVLYKKIGNIRENDFDKIWESKQAYETREFIKKGKCPCYTNCNQVIPLVITKFPEIFYNLIK